MATTSAPLRPPTKWQIAKAVSGAVPAELSNSPVLGILGVVMGAGIVTLAGRLLSLGTADLKGSLGIGYDDGAWIGSAFNIALMFIGPFTVYLGGLLGARRVLVIAAIGFTLVNCLLPLVHTYGLLLAGLVLGRADIRNVLSANVVFRAAQYSTSIPSFYARPVCKFCGWRRKHSADVVWMVSRSSFISVDVLEHGGAHADHAVVHLSRNSRNPPPPKRMPRLQASRDFSTGVRGLPCCLLRWIRDSGSTGGDRDCSMHYFSAASFFLGISILRRLRSPNPLVDLPFLRRWNTIILRLGADPLSVLPSGHDHSRAAVAFDSRIRGGSNRSGGDLVRAAAFASGICCGAAALAGA